MKWCSEVAVAARMGKSYGFIVKPAVGGNLIILHDIEGWNGLAIVKEIEGFRIVKAA